MKKKVIVLLSGGQDSTTCLYWAKKGWPDAEIIAFSFNYGQRHLIELEQCKKIARDAGVSRHVFRDVRGLLEGSSLTDHDLNHNESHSQNANLPASFTAGRNMLFLTIAASWGFNNGIFDIVTGVCQTDYSGYPDCRRSFINSMENTLSLAMDTTSHQPIFQIHTPLMFLTKAETFKLAKDLGVAYTRFLGVKEVERSVLDVIIRDTMTDYNGDTTPNEWGMGRLDNPASKLRAKGYEEAKMAGWV